MSAMVICRYRLARRLSPSYSILACPPTLCALRCILLRVAGQRPKQLLMILPPYQRPRTIN